VPGPPLGFAALTHLPGHLRWRTYWSDLYRFGDPIRPPANWVQASRGCADPTWMRTSVQVMFLVILVAVSTIFAFYLEVRRGAEDDRFIKWLKTERKDDWDALTRPDRLLTIRAVEILRRGTLADDTEFHVRYQLTRHGTRFATAMSVAGTGIALLVLGTVFFDWNW